jgi:hypothetical protein
MSLTFNKIHTISNTEGRVASATPTSERLRKKLKEGAQNSPWKYLNSPTEQRSLISFQPLLVMCFSNEVSIFQVFYIYSIESFVILTVSRKARNSARVSARKSSNPWDRQMTTIQLVPSIKQSIVADFLIGASSSMLTSKHKMTKRKIYAIL